MIDTATNQLAGTVGVGGRPVGVAVDNGTHRAYVGNGLRFTPFTTPGSHVITGTYLGDNTHAPSTVFVPVVVGAQPDPAQAFLGQLINVTRLALAVLVPEENLTFGF